MAAGGKGVHRQLPCLGASMGVHRSELRAGDLQPDKISHLLGWFEDLQSRLRNVRVCCGNWDRILGHSPTTKIGITGVFLDPPYSEEAGRDNDIYREESKDVAHGVREWAVSHGDDPMLRIALCGYEGEHAMPESWECLAWKANGGYGNQAKNTKGRENARRERIWFSPHCLKNMDLFAMISENNWTGL